MLKNKAIIKIIIAGFCFCKSYGQINSYLQLDGSSGYVIVQDHDDLDINTGEDFTITCWVRSGDVSNYHRFIHKRMPNAGTGYELMNNLTGHFANNLENVQNVHVGSPNWSETILLDGNWHHTAMVVNTVDHTNKLYIDGIIQNNCTATHSAIGTTSFANAIDLYFGFDTNLNNYFPGDIDEIRFWSTALTPEELEYDMADTVSGMEPDLLASWDFENVTDQIAPDISGNGHNGSLVGGAFIVNPDSSSTYVATTISQTTLPTGRGSQNARVMLVNVVMSSTRSILTEFDLTFGGTNPNNVENVDVFFTGNNSRLDTTYLFGSAAPATGVFSISGSQPLDHGNNHFWITYDISPNAVEGESIDATCETVTIGGNIEVPTQTSVEGERVILMGHKILYSAGDYNSAAYRIPAICTAIDGSLIVAADARIDNNTDLPGNIDITVRRSTDNGDTWLDPVIIADFGNYGASDPALVVDRNSGDIICLYASHVGLFQSTPANRIRVQLSRSSDHGLTWDTPVEITDQVYATGWYAAWVASGSAHQLANGRIVAAIGVRYSASSAIANHMIYSDDGGVNWNYISDVASYNGNEAKIVELNNGDLMMNIRSQNYRKIVVSDTGGEMWGTPYYETELIDPFCNADFIRYTSTLNGFNRNRILFSNPKHSSSRVNLHAFVSVDEADTWPYSKQIYSGNAAYSSLTILEDGSIGIFYENGEYESYQLSFARFSLNWLSNGDDQYLDPDIIVGDINFDGKANISDLLGIIELMLDNEYLYLADLNNDGIVNLSDAILIVDIILGTDT